LLADFCIAVVSDTFLRFRTDVEGWADSVVPFISCASSPVILELLDIIGTA